MRYKGPKGKFWEVFSQFIRQRDFYKYGTCISCGKTIDDWKHADAGHFMAAGKCGFALLFDETNVNLQCKKCNNPTWSPDAAFHYAKGLDKRYGKGTADALYERFVKHHYGGKTTKEWNAREYEAKTAGYKALLTSGD